jgi:DNA-binding CsgD family transcriptional regulator
MVTVVPVRASSATGWSNTAPRAALFLTEPERSEEIDRKLLTGCLNLAPREAALAVLLARGADLAEAAAVLRIGLGTTRWYLKRVLEKTHTHRQSELIRVLSGFADPLS